MPSAGNMEFVLGGLGACGACLFTNPLEVIKTRMQLQGELKSRGQYSVHYRNVFHAFYVVAKHDGILALQKGLVPGLWYQLFMNGVRLGCYQTFINLGLTKDKDGNISYFRSIIAGAAAGAPGALVGSPFYMLKTHQQSLSEASLAVGYQHQNHGMFNNLVRTCREHGVRGLFRGASAAMNRVTIGSAAQLSTFSVAKQHLGRTGLFHTDSILLPFCASMFSGVVVVAAMTPFDVISTRLYNQGTDGRGKGVLYSGFLDALVKTWRSEGLWGFYKGWAPSLLRVGPHTVLSLSMWDLLRSYYLKMTHKNVE